MAVVDRRTGVSSSAAFKLPCVAATTAALAELGGLLVVDGVQLAAGDRVLVKNQGTAANGIYNVSASDWYRAIDCDGPRDLVQGTLVLVLNGTTNSDTIFEQTAANPTIGTTTLVFEVTGAAALELASDFVKTLLDDPDAATFRDTLGVYSKAAVDALVAANAGMAATLFAAKGDILTATANDTPAILSVGAAGSIPMARSASTTGLAYVSPFKSMIYGLTYANNGGDATNDIDIAAGGCMDATGAYWIALSALTKQLDAAWAVGTAAGGLDTGSIADADYYIWAIARSDTGVTDALFSLSATSPTMPANYDFKRLIGWFKRVSSSIVAFRTYEGDGGSLDFSWTAPTLDVNLSSTLGTSRRTDAIKVPLDFSVVAEINVAVTDIGANFSVLITCPDMADAAPSDTAAPLASISQTAGDGGVAAAQLMRGVRTSSAGLIAARADIDTVDLYAVSTLGFHWSRR